MLALIRNFTVKRQNTSIFAEWASIIYIVNLENKIGDEGKKSTKHKDQIKKLERHGFP
jgi:hypothetical protein